MTRAATLAALVIAGAVFGAERPAVSVATSDAPTVRVAAHRGGDGPWPENSLPAFRNALALGADFLETDVHLTADGEVVVLHDPTLERTTTGRGAVADAGRADVARLRLKTRDGAVTGESIPTLAALLDLLRGEHAQLLLEIKTDGARRPYPGIEGRALARLRERDLVARTVVMAFEADTLSRVRALDVAIRTALLVGRRDADAGAADAVVRRARAAGATHLGIDHRILTPDLVRSARAERLHVMAWTVNDDASVRRVLDVGVDVVITDHPELALRLTRSQ